FQDNLTTYYLVMKLWRKMPTTARLNDKGTQYDDYYETVSIAGLPTVFIDGLPVARMSDAVDCGGGVI
ncbi:PAAR domain-containing protein, partial [Salmonella enterica]|uniref:PAAR domain-containing protein n=2 Tax=Salmonella enterica TaxID=28901 RepID=UPI001F4E20ED